MADAPNLMAGAVGSFLGAVAVSEYNKAGTEWNGFNSKFSETVGDLEGVLKSCTFILGRAASAACHGLEQISKSLAEGRAPSGSIVSKADWDACVDSGKQGADFLVRGCKVGIEALVEGARILATRFLIQTEHTKDAVLHKLPAAQQKVSECWNQFLKGYQGGSGGSCSGMSAPIISHAAYHSTGIHSSGGGGWW